TDKVAIQNQGNSSSMEKHIGQGSSMPSTNKGSQFHRDNYEEIDSDYAEFLEKYGEDYYERLENSGVEDAPNTYATLPNELSKFVRDFNLQSLILEVPGTNSSKVHLKYPTDASENVQIVGGWKNFCFDNGIQFGDRLRIEFKHVYPNVGKVFKVTT
ncbi:hypothetical protein L195_g040266, partial [Trifolium pratense]